MIDIEMAVVRVTLLIRFLISGVLFSMYFSGRVLLAIGCGLLLLLPWESDVEAKYECQCKEERE